MPHGYPLRAQRRSPSIPVRLTNDHLAVFDYVVVLMMENRSCDNLLGYLYEPDSVPRGATLTTMITGQSD